MTQDSIDRTYIKRHLRARSRWVTVLAFFAVLAGVLGYFNVSGLVKDLTTTYTATEGTVIEEGMQQFREGTRRNKRWVDHRVVTIEYTVAGEAGSDQVRSDTIQVGETVPIWVDSKTGGIVLEQPAGPGFWNWTWAIVVPLLGALFLWGFIVALRNSIRLSGFRPDGRQPDFVLQLRDIASVDGEGKNAKKRTLQFKGVIESSVTAARVGAEAQLAAQVQTVPAAQIYPPRIPGYFLKPGAEDGIVVLHTPELGAWWAADLTFPADAAVEVKAQNDA